MSDRIDLLLDYHSQFVTAFSTGNHFFSRNILKLSISIYRLKRFDTNNKNQQCLHIKQDLESSSLIGPALLYSTLKIISSGLHIEY